MICTFLLCLALGHCEILYFLLESLEDGSDIDILDHIHATPAHDAAEYGQTEAMILLLKHGANVNIKDTVSYKGLVNLTNLNLHTLLYFWSVYSPCFQSVVQYKSKGHLHIPRSMVAS